MAERSDREVRGVIAFIGVGSNLGDPLEACRRAVGRVAAVPGIELLRCSPCYRTEPVGVREQNWFINQVIEVRTTLVPRSLLTALQAIERQMGRSDGLRWGPRVIDLDLLLYGQQVLQEEGLVVPHPELHRRAFVLVPLDEIASYVIHPAFGVSIRGLLGRLEDHSRVERLPEDGEGAGTPIPAGDHRGG